MIVHHVQIVLHGSSLGDELHHLLHHVVGKVLGQEVEDETVGGLEVKILQMPGVDLSHQNRPGQVWDHHSCKSVDETDDGETNEEHPPHPEDKEVLLVEDVVVKNAKIVGPVNSSSGGTNVDVTRDLSGEEFAHWIMSGVSSIVRVEGLFCPNVSENFLAVSKELVEEERIGDEHGEDAHQEVQELAESKVEMISAESWLKLDEVVSDGFWVTVGSDDVLQHSSFQKTSPEGAGHLGESKAEGEKEGKPKIVGGDRSICGTCDPGLINEASCRLSLEVVSYVSCSVDPAVGPGIIISSLANDRSSVKMIFQENKQQSKHNNEGCGLMMKLKQRIVYCEFVTLEPFEKAADKGQTIDNCWGRHREEI